MGGKRKKAASYHYKDDGQEEEDSEELNYQKQRHKMWGSSSSSSNSKRGKGTSRSSSSRPSSNGVNEAIVLKLFNDLADNDDPTIISMEGISNFCDQLNIDVCSDIRIMVLLWKLGAGKEKPQQISKTEWCEGCVNLETESIVQFRNLLPSLETGFLERSEFKSFYKFCFQFSRQGKQTTLDKELVADTLQLVLKDHVESERLRTFNEFLAKSTDESYKRVTLDQWTSFLDFCYECNDLSDYDEATSAWPVLIDDYVDYMLQQNSK
eukprot:CAMPEP_0197832316 /NCGR_PEP_ID=MMETSP1437-20131217/14246_1 /TAXON_ID=49252 ORGANISM="Eucampia antarctica, Strain CCMP1452" /NCGR_SAMPLE_ID=MMETSP1437 /ASSEMBLY_ACC=CAM_ASM_001096 /LENGTH=265 /DNA_ID=CAMNT_0043435635 /DNA_START=31 /DNA_END=828 /DNA_ORIENTATION=+